MRVLIISLLIALYSSASTLPAFGQRASTQEVEITWAEHMQVDGDLSDWGGELAHQFQGQKLSYEIKNNDSHLFLAIMIQDMDRQMQALQQGISFIINKDGKKRPSSQMVFPVADRIAFREIMSADNDARPEDMRDGAMQAVRGIFVSDMPGLKDGMISLNNQYGMQAQVALDEEKNLIVEMSIPLERLEIDRRRDVEDLAFNIKINGVIIPISHSSSNNAGMYGRYGYPAYNRSTPNEARSREEPGVWVISPLATKTY